MNVPLAWVIWIALIVKACTASTSLESQLGGTKPKQFHFCENLDDNLELFALPSTVTELPCEGDNKMHGLTEDQKTVIRG